MSRGTLQVGVDVGGTFTDLFAYDDASGQTWSAKVPTTVDNQARGVLATLEAAGIDPADVGLLAHGTTTGLNALLERAGARAGLITTEGFRDVLEIMRTDRQTGYDLAWDKPVPYVPRHLRREVPERVLADGSVEQPLDEDAARAQVAHLRDAGVESIAVCLLHAYANPEHERRLGEIVREEAPGVGVSLSHDVNAELREFERTNTVVIDAYIKPVMVRYIERLVEGLAGRGFRGRLLLMQGNGGMATAQRATDKPIVTLSSGPAAGAIAAADIAATAGIADLVTFDVGGTSTDVALVHDGQPFLDSQKQIEWGLPARVPMLDVASVGAGGGSIGWIDSGGALKMGPRSAGATPGPVSYGNGGAQPTLSDALLLKGVLGATLAGGTLELDPEAARRAVERELAEPLGLSVERVVDGMVAIAQENMANAVRSVSIWKGMDPRDLTLVAFGGAGGLVAGPVAEILDIPRVLVPPVPGNACAMGTLMTDVQEDAAVAFLTALEQADLDELNARRDAMRAQVLATLADQGIDADGVELAHLVDMRYQGQIHELRIPIPTHPVTAADLAGLRERFERTYEETYTVRLASGVPECVTLRVSARSPMPHYSVPEHTGGDAAASPVGHRSVTDAGERWDVPVYDRYTLAAGTVLEGPVILEEAGSTTWVAPRMSCEVDARANLIVNTRPLAPAAAGAASDRQEA
jgi:N-methylhydantoinase A